MTPPTPPTRAQIERFIEQQTAISRITDRLAATGTAALEEGDSQTITLTLRMLAEVMDLQAGLVRTIFGVAARAYPRSFGSVEPPPGPPPQ